MMKFFRKYNKTLLAFFMVLLMIVFLGGSAVQGLFRQGMDQKMAVSRFGPITSNDYRSAQDLTGILDKLGIRWEQPIPLRGLKKPLELVDWILLTREAKSLGTEVPVQQIRATLNDYSTIDNFARRMKRKPERILQAMASFNTVQQTAISISGAVTPSQAQITSAMRQAMEKVRVNAVLIPAVAFVDPKGEFSDDEIQAQFEKYREREPGEGLAFGYYVDTKLKVQYIKIDKKDLAEKVRIPNLESKAKEYYTENKATNPAFKRPPEEPPLFDDVPAPKQPTFLSWEEAKDKAIVAVREDKAVDASSRIANWLIQKAGDPWLDVTRNDDGYKTAPTRVADLGYYDKLLEDIPRTIAYPGAMSTAVTGFFDRDEAESLPVLGSAFFVGGKAGTWETLKSLAFRSQPIIEKVPKEAGASASDFLSLWQTSTYALRDQNGSLFIFRIVDTQPGHAAKSVDEVRDRVVADLRLAKAFAEAKTQGEAIERSGDNMTLKEAYEGDEALASKIKDAGLSSAGYLEPPAVPRSAKFFVTSGMPPRPFLGAGIGQIPQDVLDGCFALPDSDHKTALFELDDRAAVLVVQLVDIEHPEAKTVDEQRASYRDDIERNRSSEVLATWLDPDHIRARNGFSLAVR